MPRLSDDDVRRIAARLAGRLGSEAPTAELPGESAPAQVTGEGLFPDPDVAVEAAAIAFAQLGRKSLALRKAIVAAMRESMLSSAEALAKLAHEETGYGRLEDKIAKNRLVATKTPGTEALDPGARSGDRGLVLFESAPYGVIGAITPVTNPTSTIICNSIGMIAAGNAVVFNAHPAARHCGAETVRLLNRAIIGAGGPPNLVCAITEPSVASAQVLMRHGGVRLLVVTGGSGVVGEAMNSGKRAICAGPGNPPVVVDETADIARAARDIVRGASFDNNIICVDEKVVFAVNDIADQLLREMVAADAYLVDAAEMRRLERVIFAESRGPRQPAVMSKDWIGQDASSILAAIGVTAPRETRLVIADLPAEHPLVWTEQMMPVLPIVRVPDADRAISLAREAEHGFGHSAAMHSLNLDNLSRMAREMNTSIFVKNGPCFAGLGEGAEGYSSFTIASPTGEGLTGPRSFSRERRCVLVDHFRIV